MNVLPITCLRWAIYVQWVRVLVHDGYHIYLHDGALNTREKTW